MARAIRSIFFVFAAVLVTACTTVELETPAQEGASAAEIAFNQKIDLLLQNQRSICTEQKYSAMHSKSPCLQSDITFAQLADNSKVTKTQRDQVIDAFTRMDRLYKEMTDLYRGHGTEQSNRIAQARDWAFEQSLNNRLNLVNRNITWGEYLKQRKSINAEMMRKAQ